MPEQLDQGIGDTLVWEGGRRHSYATNSTHTDLTNCLSSVDLVRRTLVSCPPADSIQGQAGLLEGDFFHPDRLNSNGVRPDQCPSISPCRHLAACFRASHPRRNFLGCHHQPWRRKSRDGALSLC